MRSPRADVDHLFDRERLVTGHPNESTPIEGS
jgi:hypothetical protein